jgi:hypothetical protein
VREEPLTDSGTPIGLEDAQRPNVEGIKAVLFTPSAANFADAGVLKLRQEGVIAPLRWEIVIEFGRIEVLEILLVKILQHGNCLFCDMGESQSNPTSGSHSCE